ncbi:hypothetical protein V1520DRAFT_158094 [Lipomyces starkeyi]
MVDYRSPTPDSPSDNYYSDSAEMTDQGMAGTGNALPGVHTTTTPDENVPTWLRHFLQVQHEAVNAQQQQMLQLIQQQGQRLDHMASLFAQGQGSNQTQTPNPDRADGKRPRAKLPDGKDHVWYCFSRLDGKAAARVYPWMSTYKDSADDFTTESFYKQLKIAFEDPAHKDKALNRLNTLRQGNRPFSELMSELDRLL